MKVRVLEKRHSDYDPKCWHEYDLLYCGGKRLQAEAEKVLIKNTAEHPAWFKERARRFTYKNIVGTIIDDYGSTVLQEPLELMLQKEDGQEERPKADKFYSEELWKNPTNEGKGENLTDLAFKTLVGAMVMKRSWIMLTMPQQVPGFLFDSLAEQEAAGALRVMFRKVDPVNVVNWSHDSKGLASVMTRFRIASPNLLADPGDAKKPKDTIQWVLYTRKAIRRWQIEVEAGKEPDKDHDAIEQGTESAHILANAEGGQGAVPVRPFELSDTLWLMDRVGLLALEELRKRNALSWYEFITCFPQLVHKGDDALADKNEESGAKRGVQYAWEVEKEGELDWLEVAGSSLSHNKERLDQLERDIYKGVQQMAAAQGPGAAAAMQSGFSKVRDNLAKTILCERYAARLRAYWKVMAGLASEARGDDYEWECAGASRYDSQDQDAAVTVAIKANALPWINHSETLAKALWKKTARALLPDASSETLDRVAAELDAAEVKPPADPDEFLPGGGSNPPGRVAPGGRPTDAKKPQPKPGERVGGGR